MSDTPVTQPPKLVKEVRKTKTRNDASEDTNGATASEGDVGQNNVDHNSDKGTGCDVTSNATSAANGKQEPVTSVTYNGQVKWFDYKKGFGFIQKNGGAVDVFVHFSKISTNNEFKMLYPGEHVVFEEAECPGNDELQAINVRAPYGGKLLHEFKSLDTTSSVRRDPNYNFNNRHHVNERQQLYGNNQMLRHLRDELNDCINYSKLQSNIKGKYNDKGKGMGKGMSKGMR